MISGVVVADHPAHDAGTGPGPESGPAVVPYSDAYSAVSNSPYTRHASCSGMNGSELV